MMRLTILEHAGQPVSAPHSVFFVPPGATIGRGADNHLVLPDETRQISRLQALVRLDESGAYLKNLSSVCPVDVNQRTLLSDQEHRLNDGDLIRIGIYQLRVDGVRDAPKTAPAVVDNYGATGCVQTVPSSALSPLQGDPRQIQAYPPQSGQQSPGTPDSPVADLMPTEADTGGDSFMVLFENAGPIASPEESAMTPLVLGVPAKAHEAAGDREEATDAPVVVPPAVQVSAPRPVVSPPPTAFWDSLVAEFAPTVTPQQFDHVAESSAPLDSPPTPHVISRAAEPTLASLRGLPVDPLDLFSASPAEGPSALFSDSAGVVSLPNHDPLSVMGPAPTVIQTDSTHEIASHFPVPRLAAQPAQVASNADRSRIESIRDPDPASGCPLDLQAGTPLPAAAGSAIAHESTAAPISPPQAPADHHDTPGRLAAFLQGAGVDIEPTELTEAQCRQAGRLLAGLIHGTMDLLSSRTIIKREVKADLTMILDRENNPLKLLPDAQAVLKQMFGPPLPGFMTPEHAMEDAFHDLHAHQMGMLAGMRTALNQLLRDVSPGLVEQQLPRGSWYERIMPQLKGSRAWLRYRALHQSMINAVEDDFHAIFGNAFLTAYDAEVELYRQQRKRSGQC